MTFNPAVGRWLTEDPIDFDAGDPNLYRYCANDSVNNMDPSGLASIGRIEIQGKIHIYYLAHFLFRSAVRRYRWEEYRIGVLDEKRGVVERGGYEVPLSTIQQAVDGTGYNVTTEGWRRYIKENATNRDYVADAGNPLINTAGKNGTSVRTLWEATAQPTQGDNARTGFGLSATVGKIGLYGTLTAGGAVLGMAANANKLHHIFGNARHKLDPLLKQFGGDQAAAYDAVEKAVAAEVARTGTTGTFNQMAVSVGGVTVHANGAVIDGATKLGTFFIR